MPLRPCRSLRSLLLVVSTATAYRINAEPRVPSQAAHEAAMVDQIVHDHDNENVPSLVDALSNSPLSRVTSARRVFGKSLSRNVPISDDIGYFSVRMSQKSPEETRPEEPVPSVG